MRYLGMRVLTQFLAGHQPGPDAGITKLYWSEYHQVVTELASTSSAPTRSCRPGRQPSSAFSADDAGAPNSSASWVDTFLNARAGTIYAGSSQIQRNIIGEMVLGLPKEPKAAAAIGAVRPRSAGSDRLAAARMRCATAAVAGGGAPVAAHRARRAGGGGGRSCRCRRAEYLRFRLLTQYGDSEARASPADVVNYLAMVPQAGREAETLRGTMRSALVLNASYEPLSVVSARRAACLVLADKADVIEDDGTELRSPSLVLPSPLVIRLRYMVKVPFHRRTALVAPGRVRPRRLPLPVLRAPRRLDRPRDAAVRGGEHCGRTSPRRAGRAT